MSGSCRRSISKTDRTFKKVNKDPIDDQYGDKEGFEQELWNEDIESIKERILNEFGVVQEKKMKDWEPLNKININKKQRPREN